MTRLRYLEDYVVALIREKVLKLNPRDPLSANIKKVVAVIEGDLKIVFENIGRVAAGAAIRAGGMHAENLMRGFFDSLADRVTKK